MIKDSIPDHFRHSTLLKTPLGLAPNLIIKHPKTEVRSKKRQNLWSLMVSGSKYCTSGTPSRADHQTAGNVRVQGNTVPIPPCTHHRRPAGPGRPSSLRTLRKLSGNLRKSCNRSQIHLHRQGNRTMHHPRREREWSSCCHKRRMVGKNQFQRQSPHGLANNLPTASNTTYGRKWWVGRKRQ